MTPPRGAVRMTLETSKSAKRRRFAGRLAAPRIAAAGIACLLLSQWGIVVGTLVGWQASQSLMGLPTETFFMMMTKMMWFRDVVGLVVKGFLFGAVPAMICCYQGLGPAAREDEPCGEGISGSRTRLTVWPPPGTCLYFGPLACRGQPF